MFHYLPVKVTSNHTEQPLLPSCPSILCLSPEECGENRERLPNYHVSQICSYNIVRVWCLNIGVYVTEMRYKHKVVAALFV